VALPVLHETIPVSHSFAREQVPPAAHGEHAPLLHTMSVPQLVPLGTLLPESLHTMRPVSQLYEPLWHGLVGVQIPPVVHGPHTPLRHAMLLPHESPFMMFVVSTHTGLPVVHDTVPFLHGFDGWQLAPMLQVLQTPPLHTLFVPHDVPLSALPDSTHTGLPVVHEIIPVLQRFDGWQLAPALHPMHTPLPHTLLVPQDVPSVTLPVSVHTEVPVEHDVVPVLHGFDGWQPTPAVHAPQIPLLQTLFVPQDVPLLRLVPVSEQVIVGAHVMLPA
jgi:hypothetical protein